MIKPTHKHYILNKPYGFISQFITNDPKAKKKRFLGELFNFAEGTMAVGRLDEKTEGLLLLTTDGKVSAHITGSKTEKEYYVQVDGLITSEAIQKLETGVEIGINGTKYVTKPCKVRSIPIPNLPDREKKIRDERHGPTSWISVTITEGKFRQVRKMTASVGYATLRLVRIRVGTTKLSGLKKGEVREVVSLLV